MFTRNNLPFTEGNVNHIRKGLAISIPFMVDSKKILWENVRALMIVKYGEENPWKTAQDAKIGSATMTRIKEQMTSTGLETLEKLATLFKVEPWQLLAPKMGSASNNPKIQAIAVLLEQENNSYLVERVRKEIDDDIELIKRMRSNDRGTEQPAQENNDTK